MKLIILGKGGYGKVVADVAQQLNKYEKISFLDDASKDIDVLAGCDNYIDYIDENTEFYPAFGNNTVRFNVVSNNERHCKYFIGFKSIMSFSSSSSLSESEKDSDELDESLSDDEELDDEENELDDEICFTCCFFFGFR